VRNTTCEDTDSFHLLGLPTLRVLLGLPQLFLGIEACGDIARHAAVAHDAPCSVEYGPP
jgi:hypothetical protein